MRVKGIQVLILVSMMLGFFSGRKVVADRYTKGI